MELEIVFQTFVHTLANAYRYCNDTHTLTHTILVACTGLKNPATVTHEREILNNKYPANNECAAGCSCLQGIISNFLPMFHIYLLLHVDTVHHYSPMQVPITFIFFLQINI